MLSMKKNPSKLSEKILVKNNFINFYYPGSIPVWGSEIVFLRIELDEHTSLTQHISKLPQFKIYVS